MFFENYGTHDSFYRVYRLLENSINDGFTVDS